MCGQSSGRSIFVILAVLSIVCACRCASTACRPDITNRDVLIHITREAGGPAPFSSRIVVTDLGDLQYQYGQQRCYSLSETELSQLRDKVNSSAFRNALRAVADRHDEERYSDAEEIIIYAKGIRAVLTFDHIADNPLLPYLREIDSLARTHIGGHYRFPILPATAL